MEHSQEPNTLVPITERENSLTKEIDVATPLEITKLLKQCDSQLFSGWAEWPGLYHHETIEAMKAVSKEVLDVLHSPDESLVVLSGCGTSGRLGFFISRSFNDIARSQNLPPLYEYQIAGGDLALFVSAEAPEDNWMKGKQDLEKLTTNKTKVVFIGISCGLSAPYVAGQLDYCLEHPEVFTPVLIGFNPVSLARKRPIENWDKTFYDVVHQLIGSPKGIVLNPIVGPEALTGSSRMKGGSATKILLESVLLSAHSLYANDSVNLNMHETLQQYEECYRNTYLSQANIAEAISQTGASLMEGGHLYYLGKSSYGALGLIDASECVPTFSSHYDDLRAFLSGGFQALGNREGRLYFCGTTLKISFDDFVSDILPNASYKDTVVFIAMDLGDDIAQHVLKVASKKKMRIILIYCNDPEKAVDSSDDILSCTKNGSIKPVRICLQYAMSVTSSTFSGGIQNLLYQHFCIFLKEISVKWVLNAISTGAHILKGKVLKNFMIDVKVSNNKLFHRAITIICSFTGVTDIVANECLLKAIYRVDQLTDDMKQRTISQHVKNSDHADQVVPLAVLLVTGNFTVDSALVAMRSQRVSQIVKILLKKNVGL